MGTMLKTFTDLVLPKKMLNNEAWHGPEDMPLQTKCNDIVTLCVGIRVSFNWYKHTSWNLTEAIMCYFS